jgi:hypothetical protein
MSTEIAIIRRAREIISDPEKWTTHEGARDACNNPVSAVSKAAVCWCAAGALDRAAAELGYLGGCEWGRAAERLCELTPNNSIVEVNDEEGHAAVLSLFDKALAQEAA